MPLLSSATVLRLVDSAANVLSKAYKLAWARLPAAGSSILRLLIQRDQAVICLTGSLPFSSVTFGSSRQRSGGGI